MLSVVVIAMLVVAEPSDVGARVELRWQAPTECPSELEVAARAERLLLDSDARVQADADVSTDENGFALALDVRTARGTAHFDHREDDCEVLSDVAALFVAVSADPLALQPPPAPRPAPSTPVDAAVQHGDAPLDAVATTSSGHDIDGWLRVQGIVGVGQLPDLDAGIGLTGALAIDRFRIELGISHLLARTRPIPGLSPASATIDAWNVQLRGCLELGRERWRLAGCIGPELGAMTGRAHDVRVEGDDVGFWAAATAGPVVRWIPVERVQIHAGLDGVLALRRPSFALRDDVAATIVARAGGVRAMLGLAIGLGRARNARPRDRIGTSRRSR